MVLPTRYPRNWCSSISEHLNVVQRELKSQKKNLPAKYSLNWLQRHVGGQRWVTLVEVVMLLQKIGFIIRDKVGYIS